MRVALQIGDSMMPAHEPHTYMFQPVIMELQCLLRPSITMDLVRMPCNMQGILGKSEYASTLPALSH